MASGSIEDEAVRDALEKLRNGMPVDGAFLDQYVTAITDLADKAKSYGRYGAKSKDTSAGSAPDDHVTTDPVERHEPKVDYWQHEELQTFFAKNVMNSLPKYGEVKFKEDLQTHNLLELKLKCLSLNGSQLTHIFNCSNLTVLEVNDAFNMDDAFDVDAYGNAKQPFHTFSNPRYYGFIAGLLRMRNLKKLSLRKNNLSDYTASVVWKCRSLTDLDLSDNKFECLPPDIASSRTLVTCRLKNNDFKCSSASEMMALLGSSSRLEVLDLGGNKNMEVPPAAVRKKANCIEDVRKYFDDLKLGKQLWTDGRVLILGQQNAGKTSLRAALIDMDVASGHRVTEKNRGRIETVGIDMSTWKSNPTYTPGEAVIWRQILIPVPVKIQSQVLMSIFQKREAVVTRVAMVQITGIVLYIDFQGFMIEQVEKSNKTLDRVTFVASLLSSGSRSRFTIFSPRWGEVLRWLHAAQKCVLKNTQCLKLTETSHKLIHANRLGAFSRQCTDECWYYSGSWFNAKSLSFKSHSFFAELGTKGAYRREAFPIAVNGSKPKLREDAKYQYLDCECQNHINDSTIWVTIRWKNVHPKSNERGIVESKKSPNRSFPRPFAPEKQAEQVSYRRMRQSGHPELKQVLAVILQSMSSMILTKCSAGKGSKLDPKAIDHSPYLLRQIIFCIMFYSPRRVRWQKSMDTAQYSALMGLVGKTILKYLLPVDITLRFWDFAGQDVYYGCHQPFIRDHSTYLLAFDLSRSGCDAERRKILFWLISITTRAPTAPILLVGTHADIVATDCQQRCDSILRHIARQDKSLLSKLHRRKVFAVSSHSMQGINYLRKELFETAMTAESRLLNRMMPSFYCQVQKVIAHFGNVFDVVPVPLIEYIVHYKFDLNKAQVKTVLNFLHKAGLALYYEDLIPDWVFLSPGFITRRIANVIKEGHKGQQTQTKRMKNTKMFSDLQPLFGLLHHNGFLDMELLNFLWSDGYVDHVPKAVIVQLMCHYGVFVDISNGVGGEKLIAAGHSISQLSGSKLCTLKMMVPSQNFKNFLQFKLDLVKDLSKNLACPRVVLVPALLRHEDDELAEQSWKPWYRMPDWRFRLSAVRFRFRIPNFVPADFMGSVFSSILPLLLKNSVDYQLWKTGAQLHYESSNQNDSDIQTESETCNSKLIFRLHELGPWTTFDIATMEPVEDYHADSPCNQMLRASVLAVQRVAKLQCVCNVLSPPGLVMEGLFWGLQSLMSNINEATLADGWSWKEVAEAQRNSQRLFDRSTKMFVDPSTLINAMDQGKPNPYLKTKHRHTNFFAWPTSHKLNCDQQNFPRSWTGSGDQISCVDVTEKLRAVVQQMFDKSMEGSETVVGKEVKDTVHGKQQGQLPYINFRVLKVFRIENYRCWSKYQQCREEIKQQLADRDGPYESIWPALREQGLMPKELVTLSELHEPANECLLFHGTKHTTAPLIVSNGFDGEKFGFDKGLFGRGNYFGDKVNKADQYVNPRPKDGLFNLFLARVCMGRTFGTPANPEKNPDWWRHHNRRQAPTKDGVQYHSIVGRGFTASILEGLEYVVYKNAQTYAEYKVVFERRLRQPPATPFNDLALSAFPAESIRMEQHRTATKAPASSPAKVVKIIFISDTRGKHRHMKLPKGDILVHSGSFTDVKAGPDLLVQLADFISWINDVCAPKYKRIILVPGQHDWLLDPALATCSYLSGHRAKDAQLAQILIKTELSRKCTYLDGYERLVAFVPTRPGGPCIRIGGSSFSPPFPKNRRSSKISAFRWRDQFMKAGSIVTHNRHKSRKKKAWQSGRTQLRSEPHDAATRTKEFIDPGEKVIVKHINKNGYAFVEKASKPIEGYIKTKNIHSPPFDPHEHWEKVLLINVPEENKLDILVSHCPPAGVLDSADLPGCVALSKSLDEHPEARPSLFFLSGKDNGHSTFREMCCTHSTSATGASWLKQALMSTSGSGTAWGGTIFLSGCQTGSLPSRLQYKSRMCPYAVNAPSLNSIPVQGRRCPNIKCDLAHSQEEVRNVMPHRDILNRITIAREQLLSVGEEFQPHHPRGRNTITKYISRTAEEIEEELKEATKMSSSKPVIKHRFKVQVVTANKSTRLRNRPTYSCSPDTFTRGNGSVTAGDVKSAWYYSLVQWKTGVNQDKGYVKTHSIDLGVQGQYQLSEACAVHSCTDQHQSELAAGTVIDVIARDVFVYLSAPTRFAVGDDDEDDNGDYESKADTTDAKVDQDNDGFLPAELVRNLGEGDESKGKKIVLILRREFEMLRKTPTTANADSVWVDDLNLTVIPTRVWNSEYIEPDMQRSMTSPEGVPFVWVQKFSSDDPSQLVSEGYIRASLLSFNAQKSLTGEPVCIDFRIDKLTFVLDDDDRPFKLSPFAVRTDPLWS